MLASFNHNDIFPPVVQLILHDSGGGTKQQIKVLDSLKECILPAAFKLSHLMMRDIGVLTILIKL